ncbi:MAG TPA: hypothetical protein VJB93_02845 [Patescibacteria group bacterium]|nr:hypothetical protein [Patescibacteria group bacterium]
MKKYIIFISIGVILLAVIVLIMLFGVKKKSVEPPATQLPSQSQESLPIAPTGARTLNQQEQQEQGTLKRVFAQDFGGKSSEFKVTNVAVANNAAMGSWIAGELGGTLIAQKVDGEWKYVGGDGGLYNPRTLLREFGIPLEDGRKLLDAIEPDWREFVSAELQ